MFYARVGQSSSIPVRCRAGAKWSGGGGGGGARGGDVVLLGTQAYLLLLLLWLSVLLPMY